MPNRSKLTSQSYRMSKSSIEAASMQPKRREAMHICHTPYKAKARCVSDHMPNVCHRRVYTTYRIQNMSTFQVGWVDAARGEWRDATGTGKTACRRFDRPRSQPCHQHPKRVSNCPELFIASTNKGNRFQTGGRTDPAVAICLTRGSLAVNNQDREHALLMFAEQCAKTCLCL